MGTRRAAGAPRLEQILADALEAKLGQRPEVEFKFFPHRDWRLDLAYPELRIGVEIDGARHGSFKQRAADCEKQNAAAVLGWRIFRYPAKTITTKSRFPLVVEQIARAIVCEPFADCSFPISGEL